MRLLLPLALAALAATACGRLGYEEVVPAAAEAGVPGQGAGDASTPGPDGGGGPTMDAADGPAGPVPGFDGGPPPPDAAAPRADGPPASGDTAARPDGPAPGPDAAPPPPDGAPPPPADTAPEPPPVDAAVPPADAPTAPDMATSPPAPDAAAPDGAPVAASLCASPRPGDLDCWDFDDPAGPLPRNDLEGTAVRNTTRAAAGPGSVDFTTFERAGQVSTIAAQKGFQTRFTTGGLYLRGFFFVPSTTVAALRDWAVLMELSGGGDKVSFDVHSWGFALHSTRQGFVAGQGAFPQDRWVCVELHVTLDRPRPAARLLFDGQMVLETPPSNALLFNTGADFFRGGIVSGPANPEVRVSLDEYLVTTAGPVGCAR